MPIIGKATAFRIKEGTARFLRRLQKLTSCRITRFKRRHLTYYDTFDWRLQKQGLLLCRRRIDSEKSLVLSNSDNEVLSTCRSDSDPTFVSDIAKGPLRSRLEGVVEVRRLTPVLMVEDEGAEAAVLDGTGKTVVRLLIRTGTVRRPGKSARVPLPRAAYLSPVKGYEEEFERVLEIVQGLPSLIRLETTASEALFSAAGVGAVRAKKRPPLRVDEAALAGVCTIAADLLDQICRNQEGTRKDLDIEFLHEFRVAVRKTRSLLTQTRTVWPERLLPHYLKEFKWLGGVTGPTRDLDVHLQIIREFGHSLPEARQPAIAPLLELVQGLRMEEFAKLKRALGTKRFRRLTEEWKKTVKPGVLEADPGSSMTLGGLASARIWKAFRRTVKKGQGLRTGTDAETLHRLRIECKKLRYLLEFFRSLYDAESIKAIIESLKSLQDQLGEVNDLRIQRGRLWDFAHLLKTSSRATPDTYLAIGQMLERMDARQRELTQGVRTLFDAFSSEALQDNLRSVLDLQATGKEGT